MNEEIEYAEMLEIPLSTVNVAKKHRKNKRERADEEPMLKESVIARVNDRLNDPPFNVGEGELDFDSVSERIDTLPLFSEEERRRNWEKEKHANDEERVADEFEEKYGRRARITRRVLTGEFAAVCVLCGAIFLTNAFMPSSAINVFFRGLNSPTTETADMRDYSSFTLSSAVGTLSDTSLTLSPTGILSFTGEGCVYPLADGTVKECSVNEDGAYTIKIAHSDSFSEIIGGLDYVYYAEGDEVKANVPLGYSEGETEVQVTLYENGELLNCFELSENNELSWVVSES